MSHFVLNKADVEQMLLLENEANCNYLPPHKFDELCALYSVYLKEKLVEFFDYKQDPLKMYFLDKIQSLATNNHIKKERMSKVADESPLQVLEAKSEPPSKTITMIRNQRIREFHFHTKLSSTLEKIPDINKEIVQEFQNIMSSNNMLIEHCMKTQASKIRERVLSRRNQSLNSTGLENDTIG